jgi:hypothetical protein
MVPGRGDSEVGPGRVAHAQAIVTAELEHAAHASARAIPAARGLCQDPVLLVFQPGPGGTNLVVESESLRVGAS